MTALEIVIIVVVAVAFVAAVGTILYKKITHKGGGCDCGCDGCNGCSSCHLASGKSCPSCQSLQGKKETDDKPRSK